MPRSPASRGRAGTDVTLTVRADGKARDVTLDARDDHGARRRRRTVRTVDGKKVGVIALAHVPLRRARARCYGASRKRGRRQGAKGIVLDLRGNGGGLVNEAQLVASAFLPDGKIVTTEGRAVPARTLERDRRPDRAEDAAGRARRPRHARRRRRSSRARCRTASAAKLVGTRTFGKGVFQEVIELSNGGALDITAGQYFTPNGRNLGGSGVATGSGPDARRRGAQDDPKTQARRGARTRGARARLARREAAAASARPRVRVVGLLAKRGRFLVAEPFFERGRRARSVERRPRRARPATSALRRGRGRRQRGARRSCACSGAPTSRATSSRR